MSKLEVVAIFRVKPEAIEVARPSIVKLAEETRKEPGCLRYDWYQDTKEPGVFVVLETFADEAAFAAHAGSVHSAEIKEAAQAWLAAPTEVRILKPEYVKE